MNILKRQPSFEILRVLAMLMIVIWHFYLHGLEGEALFQGRCGMVNYLLSQYIIIICSSCVNLYIIISGFFLISSHPPRSCFNQRYFPVFAACQEYVLLVHHTLFSIDAPRSRAWKSGRTSFKTTISRFFDGAGFFRMHNYP